MILTDDIWTQLNLLRNSKTRNKDRILVNGRLIIPTKTNWERDVSQESSWIKFIRYVPASTTRGFFTILLKPIAEKQTAKIKQGKAVATKSTFKQSTKQLVFPLYWNEFIRVVNPKNVPFDGVGTALWRNRAGGFQGVSQAEGGTGEQSEIVEKFRKQVEEYDTSLQKNKTLKNATTKQERYDAIIELLRKNPKILRVLNEDVFGKDKGRYNPNIGTLSKQAIFKRALSSVSTATMKKLQREIFKNSMFFRQMSAQQIISFMLRTLRF